MTIQNIQSDYGNATVAYSRKAVSTEETYRNILAQKLEQQDEVIRNGSTEEAIPLGGTAFTTDEWDAMLSNFDATMDDLREQMRAEHAKRYEEQLEKAAQIAAELERAMISGDVGETSTFDERTPNGIVSVNRDGVSYNDNADSEKNWALLFEGEYYETVFEFVKMHRVLGTDLSDYKQWDAYFEENEIQIQRIWSDEELEQGFLNN